MLRRRQPDRRTDARIDDQTRQHLSQYLSDIKSLPNESAKTHRFIALLDTLFRDASLVSAFTRGVEHAIRIDTSAGTKRGRVDAYYGHAVIEFENSLRATGDHAKDQLREYVSGIWKKEGMRPLLAIASDGIAWRTYRPYLTRTSKGGPSADDVKLECLREIALSEKTFADFWIWLTSILYRPQQLTPTVEQFTFDFGSDSPAFRDALAALHEAWETVGDEPEPRLALDNWQRYLMVTYGQIGSGTDPDVLALFLKHTYLASLARLLAWASLSKGTVEDSLRDVAKEVLSGRFFEAHQLANLVEDDFFQWVRRPEADRILAPTWERIIVQLQTYNMSHLGEDVLKGVYQELVDPKDRHELGEYYTPDWLCQRMVKELLPETGFVSVIDPTCGSGSFLRAVVHHLRAGNKRKADNTLLGEILEHVVGIDIHPLAVTISRMTYLLALGDLVKATQRPIQIPVYLADSLFLPTEVTQLTLEDQIAGIELKFGGHRVVIPESLVEAQDLFDGSIAAAAKLAVEMARGRKETAESLRNYLLRSVSRLQTLSQADREVIVEAMWRFTESLTALIKEKRNSIWAFIIRNTYRPAMLKEHFDVVIGNPPWLSYRYIADPAYQDEVKERAITQYQIAPESQKLVTQMELATVFLAHCLTTFGKDGARLGFVMPRSVLSADQHVQLRTRSYSAPFRLTGYWDLRGVTPLFNVPACVLFARRQGDRGKIGDTLPVRAWDGHLDDRDLPWDLAASALTARRGTGRVIFLGDRTALSTEPGRTEPNPPSPYATQFRQGATILPRNFYFVRVKDLEGKPDPEKVYWAETDPEQAEDAKPPYDDVVMRGQVEGRFIYATAIAKHVMPFHVLTPALIAVPIARDGGALTVRTAEQLRKDGFREMAAWMRRVEKIWTEKRGAKAPKQTVYEWLDYQSKLTHQTLSQRYAVLYNAAGTNVAAAVLDRQSCQLPFLVDHTLYWIACAFMEEADYLAAILNAPAVNAAIKPFQSMGLMGERHVHKKVLDLPIPEYDDRKEAHRVLADMGKQGRAAVARLVGIGDTAKRIGRQRQSVRENIQDLLAKIDATVITLLHLEQR